MPCSKSKPSHNFDSRYRTNHIVRSMDWYESIAGKQASHKLDETSSLEESTGDAPQNLVSCHRTEMDLSSECVAHHLDGDDLLSFQACTRPLQNGPHADFTVNSQVGEFQGSLGSTSSLADDGRDPNSERLNPKSPTFVIDAADTLLNAMTKMMNNRGRRDSPQSDEGVDMESDMLRLSHPQRQMLQKVLSVALERLSDEASTSSELCDDKQDWFQCDVCSKRTRLRCEMK